VIPVYQGEREIGDCLRSVLDQTYPRERYEVIVVNNGSTDRTAAVAAEFPVRLIGEPRRGVSQARNTGVEQARGELIVFTDADCVADRRWLEALVTRFDSEAGLGGVGGYLAGLNPQTPMQYYIVERQLLSQEVAIEDRPFSAPFLVTANALLPRRLIEEAGGFNLHCVVVAEDADLCWRIGEMGRRFAFAPDAVVYHRHRSTVGAFCRWMYRYGKGSVYLMKKHRRRYGIGPIFLDSAHYRFWMLAVGRFLAPWRLGEDSWERLFAGYDVLRFACFTAGRVVGSIRYRTIIL
jgi:cellulose synthase/poly-beta-1,6-N-acetylglucosamine synthase-like glycosyltransferase